MLDLLIVNGVLVDGTGAAGFAAALGVENNTLSVLRGDVSSVNARRVIDAKGGAVCPGFIDMHSHSGLMMLAHPRHEPKVRQGVTTEVIGVDGNSFAPFRSDADQHAFKELDSGLDGNPSLRQHWRTVDDYLALFDDKVAVNIAYLVGNAPLRINAMGWEDERASRPQLADMRSILRESLEAGAFGMSTGLDYPPGSYANTDELVALCQEAAKLGGLYHTHVRYALGDRFLDPFREAIEIGKRGGTPVHVTHFYQRVPIRGSASSMLHLLEDASKQGLDISFDCYPYNLSSSRLLMVLPQQVQAGGPRRLAEALASETERARVIQEVVPRGPSWQDMWLTNFVKPEHQRFEGRSIAEVAVMLGVSEPEAICELLVEDGLQLCYVSANGNGSTLSKFVSHPMGMVGSDSIFVGDFPSPRTYGTFPTILSEFVRMEGMMAFPEAIRKMTSLAADRLGIADRGRLRDGMRADVTIVDPERVGTEASRRQPKRFPIGVDYVIVNGSVVVDQGVHSGALAGHALHRGRIPS